MCTIFYFIDWIINTREITETGDSFVLTYQGGSPRERRQTADSAHCCHSGPPVTTDDSRTPPEDRGRSSQSSSQGWFPNDASLPPEFFYSIFFQGASFSVWDVSYALCHLKKKIGFIQMNKYKMTQTKWINVQMNKSRTFFLRLQE